MSPTVPGVFQRHRERTGCVWTGLLLCVVAAAGCAVNPVTGKRALSLLSTADEIAIGQSQLLFGLAGLGVALAADDSKHARQIVGATNAGIVVRVHVEINGESVYRRLGLDSPGSGHYDVLESGITYGADDKVEAGTRVLAATPGW